MRFPVTPEGGYFPFFDGQLRGVHLTDATGAKFVLCFPTVYDTDRQLSLAAWERHERDGVVLLNPAGPAAVLVLDAVAEAVARGGPIAYAPEWSGGIKWEDPQMFAHPLRIAEMERRLEKDEPRRRQRDLLAARLDLANAELRLKRAAMDANEDRANPGGEAHETAMREIFEFYTKTAAAYGLLGTPAPNSDGSRTKAKPGEAGG